MIPSIDDALDADIAATLSADHAAEPLPAGVAQRIRRRVLDRIAAAEPGHLTVQADAGAWQHFGRGIEIKVLHEAGGTMSYLLRLAPGAELPAHRHPADEECVVLQGSVCIGSELVVPAGGFHLAHRGALHATIGSEEGAVIYLRGAVPQADHQV